MTRTNLRSLRYRAAVLLLAATVSTAALADPLAQGFADPPQSARPRVWWHWMNGNITKDGIAKDLAWMKRIGIGGLQNFDAALQTPQIVEKRLVYMTPDWKDAFRYAASQAASHGLELAIAASPGWSETGGPWVQPKDALKKLVWSETLVTGGKRFTGRLATPPSITGPFQSAPYFDALAAIEGGHSGGERPGYYADAAVLAYPVADATVPPLPRAESGSGKPLDAGLLSDASLETAVSLDRSPERPATVMLTYASPRTIRAATIFVPGALPPFGDPAITPVLEVQDGAGWRKLADLPLTDVATTVGFAPVTARAFRVVLGPYSGPKRPSLGSGTPGAVTPPLFPSLAADAPVKVADLRLSEEPKIDRFEAKAGFALVRDYYALSAETGAEVAGIRPEQVIDLTSRMKADGTLDWTPPAGKWRVMRLGYSLTGKTNHPAPAEATGLEVDKYDADAVRTYLRTYLGMYRSAVGADLIGARGVQALLTDSTEVGASNWTPKLIEQFRRLRGYDPRPWLPTLTGALVGSRKASDAFLYDFRRTLADLHASEHYGTVAAVAHEHGLKVYGEALEDQRPTLGDDMAMRAHADVPMAAMWTYNRGDTPRPTLLGDMKGAASVAHLYGQNIVAAESLTSAMSPWAHAPADLKRIVDLEFAYGINRPVIHTSVHQPVDDKVPGLSLMIFGQYFNRHESWAEMAKPWVDYIARSSYLLQQGRYFADIAYFHGEEAPLTSLFGQGPLTDTPVRYGYDFVNADVLLNRLSVEGGELAAKSGARYKLLYLGGSSHRMTLPVLRRITALVEGGATVVGNAPQASPSLKDDRAEFDRLVGRLWGGGRTTRLGAGRVIAGGDVEAALTSIGVGPDFHYAKPAADSELLFLHRRLEDGDAYFVTNRKNRAERIEARFRVTGKAPEIWRAETGTSEPVSYRVEGGETVVPLDFAAEDAFFVIFRKPATAPSLAVAPPRWQTPAVLQGPWEVTFQPGRGAPASARLPALASLSEHPAAGIRYFSGIATYSKSFTLPAGARAGAPLMLDLGGVGDMAEVRVNGVPVGTLWKAPYRLDIGKAVRSGSNRLEVRVANLWVNRLIGDAQPGATKVTFTTLPTYKPDAPLRPAGLIGPVTVAQPAP